MLRNAFFTAFLIVLVYGAWVLTLTGSAMQPYRHILLHSYGIAIACYAVALLVTLTLALMLLYRFVFLKTTGRKLQHATKELHDGDMPATPEHLFKLIQGKK
jgi:hypothetical protein